MNANDDTNTESLELQSADYVALAAKAALGLAFCVQMGTLVQREIKYKHKS
jgi:hypothetical protein